jgi:hypothetical protein
MSARRLLATGLVVLGAQALMAASASAVVSHSLIATYVGSETPSGAMSPAGVAVVQSSGDTYVADPENAAVEVFNSAGVYQPSLRLTGFELARVVTADQKTGDVLVGDLQTALVDVFDSSGELLSTINGTGTAAEGMRPIGLALNETSGDIYVADLNSKVVDVFNPSGEYQPSLRLTETPPSAPVSGSFGAVRGVAVDQNNGDVYVADIGKGVVDEFDASGGYLAQIDGSATPAGSMSPWGLAVDSSSQVLYVGDVGAGVVDAFDAAGGYQGQIVGSQTTAGSIFPDGLAVDQAHNVYIADAGNGVVDVFNTVKATPPIVTVGTVSNVRGESTTLNGAVNPNGFAVTSCGFEYGTSESYGQSVECSPPPGEGEAPVQVTANLAQLRPRTVYHYRLVATSSNGTSTTEDHTFQSAMVAPVVDGKPAFASSVSQLAATLNGTIEPENTPTTYHFAYGLTSSYGSLAPFPDGSVPGDMTDHAVTQRLFGLTPGAVYHFALVANSPAGTTVGPDETFTTPPIPVPDVASGGVSEVTVSTATLTGAIDPRGWETTYHFEYGASTGYGSQWPTVDVPLGGLTGSQGIVTYLQNLQPGTVYHYRLVAANAGGTTYGSDESFTTASYPVSVIAQAPVFGPIGVTLKETAIAPSKHRKTKTKGKKNKKTKTKNKINKDKKTKKKK